MLKCSCLVLFESKLPMINYTQERATVVHPWYAHGKQHIRCHPP